MGLSRNWCHVGEEEEGETESERKERKGAEEREEGQDDRVNETQTDALTCQGFPSAMVEFSRTGVVQLSRGAEHFQGAPACL